MPASESDVQFYDERIGELEAEIEQLRADNERLRVRIKEMSALAALVRERVNDLIELEIAEAGRAALGINPDLRDRTDKNAEIERLRAALTCVVAALDECAITTLPRSNACAVEVDALRQLLTK